ncbi:MAG: biotin--[acetyl-CoA-carboxylase] ligase [Leptolyngbyaceae cyanobacterium RM1_1_2]|nr:biotin--[acetyl-CoA-carboxylase] ligase [Leptolyngbyaceae cyanobacterium RM1_1_2]
MLGWAQTIFSTCLNLHQLYQSLAAPERLGIERSLSLVHPQFHIHLFEHLSSTSAKLWELLQVGAAMGTVAIARQQSAGRGQWGRTWESPAGGLYLSLALAPNLPAAQAHCLTLYSAWGIAAALRNLGVAALLKWPNDLVVRGRKLGGILTETRIEAGLVTQAVIGVGLNVTNPVPATGINLQSALANFPVSPLSRLETVAALVLRGIIQGYHFYQQVGAVAFMKTYENLLINLGQAVNIDGHSGCVIGVSEKGLLRVRLKPTQHSKESEIDLPPGAIALRYNTQNLHC